MLPTALEMREAVDVPSACQPKGFEQEEESEARGYAASRFLASVSLEGMAEFAVKATAEGINYIGGCCGTTPEYIKKITEFFS